MFAALLGLNTHLSLFQLQSGTSYCWVSARGKDSHSPCSLCRRPLYASLCRPKDNNVPAAPFASLGPLRAHLSNVHADPSPLWAPLRTSVHTALEKKVYLVFYMHFVSKVNLMLFFLSAYNASASAVLRSWSFFE